jgi:uncharacterized phage protein (TIGR01671 family)
MNRKIKFRVWDELQKYMAYQGSPDLETIQSFMHHFGDKPLMQYTGLKDKNGKEVYEGDILRIDKRHLPFTSSTFDGKVEYIEQSARFHLIGTTHDNLWEAIYDVSGKNCSEVIGNIYENQINYE